MIFGGTDTVARAAAGEERMLRVAATTMANMSPKKTRLLLLDISAHLVLECSSATKVADEHVAASWVVLDVTAWW